MKTTKVNNFQKVFNLRKGECKFSVCYDFFIYCLGAFLLPYFIFMFLCAMPMMFLEMTVSQYSNLGPGRVWVCCPLFKGNNCNLLRILRHLKWNTLSSLNK